VILAWLRKRLGHHVCEEFTRWETFKANCSRVPYSLDERVSAGTTEIEFTRRWQERQCTICGAIQQRELEY
jgi:hypothetical protein